MSLLEAFGVDCVLMERRREADGEGGYFTSWTEGAVFRVYTALDVSMEARRAEKEGVTSVYTGMVEKSAPLEYGDYYRDKRTGWTYRVTSNPEEKAAPASASPALRGLKCFTAEKRDLPG